MDYQSLSNTQLVEAMLEAEARVAAHTKTLRQLKDELLNRKRNEVAAAYAEKGSQFGVIHLEESGHDLEITTSPKVIWDQDVLADIEREIREEWGADPSEFIERKLSVKEAKYKAWPSDLRAKFEPARTVSASAPSITITPADKEQ